MNRVLKLQYEYLALIRAQEKKDNLYANGNVFSRDETLDWERVHMASSSRLAYELALYLNADSGFNEKEGGFVDPEIAASATAIHDIGRVLTGSQKNHAEKGYEPARDFLEKTGLFTETEIEEMALAVKNHSLKTEKGTPLEEIVKDSDVIDCYQLGLPFDRPEKEKRYKKWVSIQK